MSVAIPRQVERFYLRTLLTVKRGAQSYRDLYTVNGVLFDCQSAACRALCLTFDDSEWISLFDEAKCSSAVSSLRQTFAAALANSSIIDLQSIWDRFKTAFSDGCLHRIQILRHRLNPPPLEWSEEQKKFDFGLLLLGDNLAELNFVGKDALLSGPIHKWITRDINTLIAGSLNFNIQTELEEHDDSLRRFSLCQRAVYDSIVDAIDNNSTIKTFFLLGPVVTGKTYLYKTLCNLYWSQGKIVLWVASSGIAALLLPNGSTAHSLFRIPIDCTEYSSCNVKGQCDLANLLKKASLAIWDEVNMQQRHHFEAVDGLLREFTGKKFGGIPVVLGRDFAQTLPVVRRDR